MGKITEHPDGMIVEGRNRERADIVAWLREQASETFGKSTMLEAVYREVAHAIESGVHKR
jgi:hypothetical protein